MKWDCFCFQGAYNIQQGNRHTNSWWSFALCDLCELDCDLIVLGIAKRLWFEFFFKGTVNKISFTACMCMQPNATNKLPKYWKRGWGKARQGNLMFSKQGKRWGIKYFPMVAKCSLLLFWSWKHQSKKLQTTKCAVDSRFGHCPVISVPTKLHTVPRAEISSKSRI